MRQTSVPERILRADSEVFARDWRKRLRPLVANRLVLAGTIIAFVLIIGAIFANFLTPYDPLEMEMSNALQGPSTQHFFGTDRFGRDILSRTMYGSRISLWIGLLSVVVSVIVGTILGLMGGYIGGWTDNAISRVMDIFFSFPALLLAIAIAAMLGPGLSNILLAIAAVYSPILFRIVRASTLTERSKEYVEAAHALGATELRIIMKHILPNVLSPIIVQASITFSHAILIESYLSFLGLGIQPPEPSWGTMLSEGRAFLESAPWMSIFPGLAIMLAVLAFNLIGDGVRDLLDPQVTIR
jgi:peptide/nickel transport system permease protein